MTTLRNISISLISIGGAANIGAACRYSAQPALALAAVIRLRE